MAIANNGGVFSLSLSGLRGRRPEHSVPSLPFSCSASENIPIKFSTTHFHFGYSFHKLQLRSFNTKRKMCGVPVSMAMATGAHEVLPPPLTSTSAPPSLFDGTTRLYISYKCPYAQRVWITRNCKGLQDQIQLVPIDLQDRPSWYKDKVYPPNKGPAKEFAEELISYTDTFYKTVVSSFKGDVTEAGTAFDYIETALSKYDHGPFFLGQFSLVDIAYVPFIERFQPFLMDVKNYDIKMGRPKLAVWIEEMNSIDGYKITRSDPQELVESYKKRFLANP
ncbi:glutathione S-transferase L3-like isoform X2 [Gastrolobium bilobum]|uniref:glutathione S-transferase L3-like isoform X2 n=1 Tax=Gastrolobium bilobum TaxID=150636 RepID=UPI002AB19473|nr:glutathione S-transferase L3-like isoform X2 [Gastrolobium bilobum]